MNLYLVKRNNSKDFNDDTYDSFVCAAKNEEEARNMHPSGNSTWNQEKREWEPATIRNWTTPDKVTVEHIGLANSDLHGVICASFNAG